MDNDIGKVNEYLDFKRTFRTALQPDPHYGSTQDKATHFFPADTIPLRFVDKIEEVYREIEINRMKKIIFISSGSLSRICIPYIKSNYPNVYSFYVFCFNISLQMDYAPNYYDCIQIFNHELDLLTRLMRDISLEMIKEGQNYLNKSNPEDALEYFEYARILEVKANEKYSSDSLCHENLRLLNGYKDDIGLIQKAKNMKANCNKF